jgi:hypothetical protein
LTGKCVVCGRRLKDPSTVAAGVGSACKKKLTPKAAEEVAAIISQGMECRIIGDGVIQIEIPESPGEFKRSIDLTNTWNYPKGVK